MKPIYANNIVIRFICFRCAHRRFINLSNILLFSQEDIALSIGSQSKNDYNESNLESSWLSRGVAHPRRYWNWIYELLRFGNLIKKSFRTTMEWNVKISIPGSFFENHTLQKRPLLSDSQGLIGVNRFLSSTFSRFIVHTNRIQQLQIRIGNRCFSSEVTSRRNQNSWSISKSTWGKQCMGRTWNTL